MQEQSSRDRRADCGEKNSLSKEKGLSVKDKGNRFGTAESVTGAIRGCCRNAGIGRRRRERTAEINVSARA